MLFRSTICLRFGYALSVEEGSRVGEGAVFDCALVGACCFPPKVQRVDLLCWHLVLSSGRGRISGEQIGVGADLIPDGVAR